MSPPNCFPDRLPLRWLFAGVGGGLGQGLFASVLLLHQNPSFHQQEDRGEPFLPNLEMLGPLQHLYSQKSCRLCWAFSSDTFKETSLLLGLPVRWAVHYAPLVRPSPRAATSKHQGLGLVPMLPKLCALQGLHCNPEADPEDLGLNF